MLGTIVNSIAIILGTILGIIIKKGIKEKYKATIMDGIGLTIMIIGIMGGIGSENIILVIGSIVIGGVIGEFIGIENKLDSLGESIQNKIGQSNSNISKGFVTTSLIFCVGAMAIVGALESGMQGKHEILFAKSLIDGILSIIFASTLGIGVGFSAVSVFFYQGAIALLANSLKDLLNPGIINEISSIGGILIMGIGINILGIKKIKVGNLLPAVFIPIIYQVFLNILVLVR